VETRKLSDRWKRRRWKMQKEKKKKEGEKMKKKPLALNATTKASRLMITT
jgi:hypothetical protein